MTAAAPTLPLFAIRDGTDTPNPPARPVRADDGRGPLLGSVALTYTLAPMWPPHGHLPVDRRAAPELTAAEEQHLAACPGCRVDRMRALARPLRPHQIGPYQIEGVLGSGGMARVYAGRHTTTGAERALKLLTLGTRAANARFAREALAQSAVQHEHVLPVLEVLDLPDGTALVLPWVKGPTLAALLQGAALSFDERTSLFAAVCAGVGAIHRAGLVHRDLKPANVLLDPNHPALVRVADFGLAKVLASITALTHTGTALGTPGYMAPELERDAADVDARADVYSLGRILADLLGPDDEPTWRALVATLTTRDRAGRPPDADAVLAALPPTPDRTEGVRARCWALTPIVAPAHLTQPPESPDASSDLGACVAGRYLLREPLGEGGAGSVFAATDVLTRDEVAVKLIPVPGPDELARVRREVTALRRLRVPGVVRLLDEGVALGQYFVVMERLVGAPFPGRPVPVPWAELRPIALELLRVLGRVHTAGIVHRDLKPANVLVAGTFVSLLDFGVAGGRGVGPDHADPRLTPRWAAPERVRGAAGDVRTDLYGVGRLVQHATAHDLPPADQQLLDRLVAPEPADRPGSVGEVLAEWSPAEADPLSGLELPPGRCEVAALERLFGGPEPFLHLPSDGARALHAASGGVRVREALLRWVASGLASVADGRVEVDRAAVDRLLWSRHWASSHELEARLEQGEIGRARGQLEEALDRARADEDADEEGRLLVLLSACAAAAPALLDLDLAAYELGRAVHRSPAVEAAEALVGAERAIRCRDQERAGDLLASIDPHAGPTVLARWYWALRVRHAARRGDEAHREALEALQEWAEPAGRATSCLYLDLEAGRYYAAGDYARAAELAARAAATATRPEEQVRASIGEATARLEVPELDRVAAIADGVVRWSVRVRHPAWELRGTWLGRAAAYRSGALRTPATDLVRAAAQVGGESSALLALNEAGVAWRAGDGRTAAELAGEAHRRGRAVSNEAVCLLASALRVACAPEVEARGPLIAAATRAPVPEVAVQALGLLAAPEAAARAAALVPPHRWRDRLDLLSVEEAVDLSRRVIE